jgi:hypothetical protein
MLETRLPRNGNNRSLMIMAVISVSMISACAYCSILSYFFTGTDTITLIETSRINSLGDFLRLFTQPLMEGSKFTDIARFFRPITSLSYAMDYSIWGLNPFGFQLTNLALNAATACLVVIVMSELAGGDILFGWISGVIFALHPILVECVPATDRRQDIITGAFMLLSIWAFLRYSSAGNKSKWLMFCSLLFYMIALGGKEIAIILPALIFVQVYFYSDLDSRTQKILVSLKESSSYIVLTVAYLIWRTMALGGIGGYIGTNPLTPGETLSYLVNVFHHYFIDLLYPADALGVLETSFANWWTLIALLIFCSYVVLFVRTLRLNQEPDVRRRSLKLVFTLSCWFLAPILLFMTTLTFSHRSMYVPAIPFCALLAYPLAECLKSLRVSNFILNSKYYGCNCSSSLSSNSRSAVIALGLVMVCYLFSYSPLIRVYDQWEASGRVGREILTKLSIGTRQLTRDGKVNLYNVPESLRSYEKKEPRAKEVTYLSDYSVKSWLNLCGFDRKLDVVIHSRSRPWDLSGQMSVAILKFGNKNLRAIVRMKPSAGITGSRW